MILFLISPSESYRFSELLERHAVDTYIEFLEANEELLRGLPAPAVAKEYYANFVYYFQEFQMSTGEGVVPDRDRPEIKSLHDVFVNIIRDEVSFFRCVLSFFFCHLHLVRDDMLEIQTKTLLTFWTLVYL